MKLKIGDFPMRDMGFPERLKGATVTVEKVAGGYRLTDKGNTHLIVRADWVRAQGPATLVTEQSELESVVAQYIKAAGTLPPYVPFTQPYTPFTLLFCGGPAHGQKLDMRGGRVYKHGDVLHLPCAGGRAHYRIDLPNGTMTFLGVDKS